MRIARISTEQGPRPGIQQHDRWAEVVNPFTTTPVFTGTTYPVTVTGSPALPALSPR